MTITNCYDFSLFLKETPQLMEFLHFRVFMDLMSGLNRSCKCNKKKRLKQIELAYKTTLSKKKDDDFFQKSTKEFLLNNNEEEIHFSSEGESIFSLNIHE